MKYMITNTKSSTYIELFGSTYYNYLNIYLYVYIHVIKKLNSDSQNYYYNSFNKYNKYSLFFI
jgi:hypothetical protein